MSTHGSSGALSDADTVRCFDTLLPLIDHEDHVFACRVLMSIVEMGRPRDRVISLILSELASERASSRECACLVIEWYEVAAPEILTALIGAISDDERWVRRAACRSLGQMGDDAREAIGALEVATNDSDPAVREAAEEAIRDIKAGN